MRDLVQDCHNRFSSTENAERQESDYRPLKRKKNRD